MTEITQAMQEALALAVGLHQDYPDAPNPHWYSKPDELGVSTLLGEAGELPDLTDLSNLFELVVPQIRNVGQELCFISFNYSPNKIEAEIEILGGMNVAVMGEHRDAGHALFLACCKVLEVIDGTQDSE